MSKFLLFVAVPAFAGLVAWNVSLSSDVADLEQKVAAARADATRALETRSAPAERAASPSRTTQQVNDLALRIAEVEKRLPAASAPGQDGEDPTAAPRRAGGAPATTAAAADSPDALRGAVAGVIEEREAARRKERMDRQVESYSRFILRDLTVTDAQRTQVQELVRTTMARAEEIRQDQTLSTEQRRERVQTIQKERTDALAGILDAQQMEAVRKRLTPDGGAAGAPGAPNGQGGQARPVRPNRPNGGGRRGNNL